MCVCLEPENRVIQERGRQEKASPVSMSSTWIHGGISLFSFDVFAVGTVGHFGFSLQLLFLLSSTPR